LKCVEAHCLSLQQRAYGNQPYDGRFSANISDGEFLCPLCKQLSNLVIPEDSHVEADSTALPKALATSAMCEDKKEIDIMKNKISSSVDISQIRKILVQTAPVSFSDDASSKIHKATHQYGSSLSRAMQLSSNSNSQRRKERDYWHPALRRWDFEDNDEGEMSPQIGSILRLMREQLISWAAVGHSAAAAESSARGSRQVMFGEVSYSSTDPWSGYTSKGIDSHPRLLELRRTLAATASLFDAVTFEVAKQLGTNDEKAKGESVSVFGSLISDILEGQHWMVNTKKNNSRE